MAAIHTHSTPWDISSAVTQTKQGRRYNKWRLAAQSGGGLPPYNPALSVFTTGLMTRGNVGKGVEQLMILFLSYHMELARFGSLCNWPDFTEGKYTDKMNTQYFVVSPMLSGTTSILFAQAVPHGMLRWMAHSLLDVNNNIWLSGQFRSFKA